MRFEILLKALDSLLAERSIHEVGLYQIAQRAGVPSASAYHFFPNKEAALLALAQVHHAALFELSRSPFDTPPETWQDMIRTKIGLAAAYHNQNPAALRLFLGANISEEVKLAEASQNVRLAEARVLLFDNYFVMPSIPDWCQRLAVYMSIMDGIFSLSYNRRGRIENPFLEEAQLATTSYLRCYLPEILTPKEAVRSGSNGI